MAIVNDSGDPTNPNNRYIADPTLPTPSKNLKKDLSGHRPSELIIQQLLQFAFDNLRAAAADPTNDILDNIFAFFRYYKIDDKGDLLQHVRQYIATTKMTVYKNYPRKEYPLPIIAVHNREEGEEDPQTFHHELLHTNPDSMQTEELVGQQMNQTLDILVITDDPLTTLIVYRLVWFICFANKFDLESYADLHDMAMSGGAISFDAQVFPNWSYSRMVTLRFRTAFDFYMPPSGPPKAIRLVNLLIETARIEINASDTLGEVTDDEAPPALQPDDPDGLIATEEE